MRVDKQMESMSQEVCSQFIPIKKTLGEQERLVRELREKDDRERQHLKELAELRERSEVCEALKMKVLGAEQENTLLKRTLKVQEQEVLR